MNTEFTHVLEKIDSIKPMEYGKSRNFIDGAVTKLSPYISRGVISTKQVYEHVMSQDYPFYKIEKFVQELAWRDYWQQIWIDKGTLINSDLKNKQDGVKNYFIPKSIIEGNTSITAIDKAIHNFYQTGYIHNHLRMYIAAISCNMAKSHWKLPAQWMYYHLLDADWASNALSWQWVCGSNSNKLYYANQNNINKYCHTTQKNTFLDVEYHQFSTLEIPKELSALEKLKLETPLPEMKDVISINQEKPTLIYNFYNLDPQWKSKLDVNRILLIEPSIFKTYPISKKSMDFMLDLSKNIDNIQLFVGEFNELKIITKKSNLYFKEHPLNNHYEGTMESRDWMFNVKGYYSSFFKFWNKCKKEIKK
jgi:deoxyribodipyrimidine photo-lyase